MNHASGKRQAAALLTGLAALSLSAAVYAAPTIAQDTAKVKDLAGAKNTAPVENRQAANLTQGRDVFKVSRLSVETSLPLKAAALDKITAPYAGRTVSLDQLGQAADKVTAYCRSHGYPAATAYVPAQTAADGHFKLAVVPGALGTVKIDNQSKLSDSTIKMLTARLQPGAILTTKQVETALYTINDLGGVTAIGVLSAGEKTGASDLTVRVVDGRKNSTILYAENYGTKAAGRYRYGLTEDVYNLDKHGGHLNAGLLISNHDLHNYTVSYEVPTGRSATTLGVGFSRMDYELGGDFSGLEATGHSDTYSLYGSTPLWRGTASSLKFTYGYDYKKLTDDLEKYTNMDARKHSHAIHLGLAGNSRGQNSFTSYSLTGYTGMLGLDSDYASYLNRYSHTEGRWSKAVLDGSHLQSLGGPWDVLLKFQSQLASRNLDSSEQLYLGGANGVRAYPQGEGSGDQGFLASAEVRYHTPVKGLMLSAYLDGGHVQLSKDGSAGNETLKGWGLGLTYARPNNYFFRFDYARRIGLDDNAGADSSAKQRMWFLAGKVW